MHIKILAVGDVCGKPGLEHLKHHLPRILREEEIAFTVVNGENAAMIGISPQQAEEIFDAGADAITLGNHSFGRKEIIPYLEEMPNILRPINLSPRAPGRGYATYQRDWGQVLVCSLIGRCSMDFGPDNPFFAIDGLLKRKQADIILVDFHAEATSEKLAMGHYLDGRVTALWGTHTHVQTADGMVLPQGTGYVTDLGMTGPMHSVLGVLPQQSISMFLGYPRGRYEAAPGPCKLDCAIFTIDPQTKRCISVEVKSIYD